MITFAIGDATGHGLQSSVIVTAMKLLFSEHAGKTELTEFLRRSSHSISLMGFRKIFLAFAIGRLHNHRLEFAGAGMPPALVYRSETKSVDEVSLKGFPLGSSMIYPYKKTELILDPGDMVLLLSDGFPELNDSNGGMIGYEKVREIFLRSGNGSPEELIQHLNQYSQQWLNGSAQNDDITFFALKRRAKQKISGQNLEIRNQNLEPQLSKSIRGNETSLQPRIATVSNLAESR